MSPSWSAVGAQKTNCRLLTAQISWTQRTLSAPGDWWTSQTLYDGGRAWMKNVLSSHLNNRLPLLFLSLFFNRLPICFSYLTVLFLPIMSSNLSVFFLSLLQLSFLLLSLLAFSWWELLTYGKSHFRAKLSFLVFKTTRTKQCQKQDF